MKKALVLAAALAVIFSCTERIQEEVPQLQADLTTKDTGPWKVVLEAGPDAVTKSYLGEKNTVRFSSKDTLAVFDGYAVDYLYGSKFSIKEGKIYNDGSADFVGELPEKSGRYLVMYPHRSDEVPYIEKYGRTEHLRFSIPQEQKATAGSYDPAAAVSMGIAEELGNGNLKVTLSNCCALAKFTMPEGSFSKVELRSNVSPDNAQSADGTSLCGWCSVDVSRGEFMVNGGYDSVTLTGNIQGGQTYYLAVAPGVSAYGIEVRIYDENGVLLGHKITNKQVTFTKGVILNFGIIAPDTTGPWAGDGTKDNPYLISSYAQLKMLDEAVDSYTYKYFSGKFFRQTVDIDCQGDEICIKHFRGNYDGGGYCISNYIPGSKESEYMHGMDKGLFGTLGENGIIRNLSVHPVKNVEISDQAEFNDECCIWYGALAGATSLASISNCILIKDDYTIALTGESSWFSTTIMNFGGLIGELNESSMSFCTNNGSITLKPKEGMYRLTLGGLAGEVQHYKCNIDRCRNNGDLTIENATDDDDNSNTIAGGIAGYVDDDVRGTYLGLTNCENNGNICAIGLSPRCGGMIGYNDSDGTDFTADHMYYCPYVHNCLNNGNITACGTRLSDYYTPCAAGIIGLCYDDDTTIALCVNTGKIQVQGTYSKSLVAAMTTYETTFNSSSCVGCYWLESQSCSVEGATPSIPCTRLYHDGLCETDVDCYFYQTINGLNTPEKRRTSGWLNEDNTDWTANQWYTMAVSWAGEATYGATGNNLRLNF